MPHGVPPSLKSTSTVTESTPELSKKLRAAAKDEMGHPAMDFQFCGRGDLTFIDLAMECQSVRRASALGEGKGGESGVNGT